MAAPAWTTLTDDEYGRYWDRFFAEFAFHPDTDSGTFPGIREPTPSITWDITAAWSDPDPLLRATHAAVNEAMLRAFRRVIPPSDSLIALDWQHPGFRFFPHRHQGGCVPVAHAKDGPATWEVPVLPDGDYYIFLAEDLSFGTFGHPWASTVCVWGEALLEAMGSFPLQGAEVIRRNGR